MIISNINYFVVGSKKNNGSSIIYEEGCINSFFLCVHYIL